MNELEAKSYLIKLEVPIILIMTVDKSTNSKGVWPNVRIDFRS